MEWANMASLGGSFLSSSMWKEIDYQSLLKCRSSWLISKELWMLLVKVILFSGSTIYNEELVLGSPFMTISFIMTRLIKYAFANRYHILNILTIMASQYAHPPKLSLPPGCSHNPLEYTLTLTLTQVSLQLIQITPKPTRLKIQMWGVPQQAYLEESTPLTFDVYTSSTLFGQYLRDMKVSAVKMCDRRNNQELGSGLINWVIFLTKAHANGSPFIENTFNITVMIYNYKKKQIAEAIIQAAWVACKINQQTSRSDERGPKLSQIYLTKEPINQHIPKTTYIQQNRKPSSERAPNYISESSQEYQHLIPIPYKAAKVEKQIAKINEKKPFTGTQSPKMNESRQVRYPASQYELEKAQLKMQSQQFLTNIKMEARKNGQANQNLITIRIYDLIITKPNISVEYLDVSVVSKQKKNSEETANKKCLRAFPFGKNNSFNVQISAKAGDVVEIELSKGGKAIFEINSIEQKGQVKAFIYGKAGKVGSIFATKLYDSSQNLIRQPQTVLPKTKLQKLQPIAASSSLPRSVYMLIRTLDAGHNYLTDFEVAIKNYSFSKPYPSFCIIPIFQLGSIFAIQMRNTKNETVGSIMVEDFLKIPISQQGLGCIVVKSGCLSFENGWVRAQLMMGTMKQINFEFSRLTHYNAIVHQETIPDRTRLDRSEKPKPKEKQSQRQSDQPERYEVKSKKQSISSEKIKDDMAIPVLKHKRNNRKIYTEMLGMNESGAGEHSEYRMQDNQLQVNEENQENEGVFLVEVLSRFLHALPAERISQMPPASVEEFISLLNHFLANREQKQLIELVIDMFVDDGVEEGQPFQLEYEEFLKCLRSYHNFLELWWRMRVDILNQLIKSEPDYEGKINRYSELGTISKQILWKKVFSKFHNSQLKLVIDKALRLNSVVTVPSAVLIQQLKKVQNYPNQLPKQASPDLIVDLGKLIKETIQSILEGSGLISPVVPEDKVNIRVMCDTLNKINICLSYWESLMLIEELKGWYNIDLDCNEGIVSGSVVEIWLKSVLNRSKVSLKAEGPKQHQVKTPLNQFKPQPLQLSSNPSQKHSKPVENKSMVKSELNDEQIQNIANLLRDNDNFRMGTFTSEKPVSKVYGNTNTIYNVSNRSNTGKDPNINKILNDDILDKSSMQESASEQVIAVKQPQPTKFLHATIKSIKLRSESLMPPPFKLRLKLYSTTEHYFLCKSTDQALDRQLVEQLPHNWNKKSKGLTIEFAHIDSNGQEGAVGLYGMLVNDQIVDLGKDNRNKTVVLYGNKEIVGKITLQLRLSSQKPPLFYCEKSRIISIQVSPDRQHEEQWKTYTIKAKSNNPELASAINFQAEKNARYEIEVNGMFYKEILNVIVDGVGSCTVPLEQLYFKEEIAGEYPVVAEDGMFVGNLQISLGNKDGLMKNSNNGLMQKFVQPSSGQKTKNAKYLVIFDSLSTINFAAPKSTTSSLTILCNIFIKDAYNRNIVYRSPFYIEHQHKNTSQFTVSAVREFSAENYLIVEDEVKEKVVTIELEYDGRCVGIGDQAIKLKDAGGEKCGIRRMYSLKYVGSAKGDILMSMGIRVLPIPETFNKYSANRIYKAISTDKFPVQPTPSHYVQLLIQNNPKLTITQQKLTRQLAQRAGAIYFYYPLTVQEYGQLVSEVLYADQAHTGHLPVQQIQQIVRNAVGEKCKDVLRQLSGSFGGVEKDVINYMGLLEFTHPEGDAGMEKWGTEIGSEVADSIDRLHREIKSKYAMSG